MSKSIKLLQMKPSYQSEVVIRGKNLVISSCIQKGLAMIPKRIERRVVRGWINSNLREIGYVVFRRFPNLIRRVLKNDFFGNDSDTYEQNSYSCVGKEECSHEGRLRKKQCTHGTCGNAGCKSAASNHNNEFIEFVVLLWCNFMLLPLLQRKFGGILITEVIENHPVIEKARGYVSYKGRYGAILTWKHTILSKKKCNNTNQERPKYPLLVVKKRSFSDCSISAHLAIPFSSYFLTKSVFNHRAKSNKAQKNCACVIFNNINYEGV